MSTSSLFQSAFLAVGLSRNEIRNDLRFQCVYGSGHLKCSHYNHPSKSWSTHLAWLKLDLVKQRVVKNYKQACQICRNNCSPYIEPSELARMIEVAVRRTASLLNGTYDAQEQSPFEAGERPHQEGLCERCKEKESPCWIFKKR